MSLLGGKKRNSISGANEAAREAAPATRSDGLAVHSSRRHKNTTITTGRVIGERREKLETASERTAARNRVKRQQRRRVIFTILGFIVVAVILVFLIQFFVNNGEEIVVSSTSTTVVNEYTPTIEVLDADTGDSTMKHLTSRMKEYIGQAEADFREKGYAPTKAVIPVGSIREVDFYLDGYTGYLKFVTDRGTGVSVEDADRMIRYLAGQGITDFEYIDLRIDGKAYWR